MVESRQPEIPFPARAETGAGRPDHIAFVEGIIEERKDHVSARRNSIEIHTKSQPAWFTKDLKAFILVFPVAPWLRVITTAGGLILGLPLSPIQGKARNSGCKYQGKLAPVVIKIKTPAKNNWCCDRQLNPSQGRRAQPG